MKLVEMLKALTLVGLTVALEAGFLLAAALPEPEVIRAAHQVAAETRVAAAPAPAPAYVCTRRS